MRWEGIPRLFLGNGSVNTFPQQQTRKQQWYSNRGTVFSVVRATAIAMQRRGKHISAAMNPHTTMEELCFLRGPCRDVTGKGQDYSLVSSILEFVKRGLESEAVE
jgi:hypothetical protein